MTAPRIDCGTTTSCNISTPSRRTINKGGEGAVFLRVALIALAACLWTEATSAAAGRTPGTFTVSAAGAATYTIPIWAPKGPRGTQPQMSLTYNSGSGNGILGVGWALAGISEITRCNQTFAQDGTSAAVALTYADRFCLDGQRLRLTSSEDLGTYGQDGTTYQTEVADFSNVTAHGVAGNGPAYFTVQKKDGLIYEYGNANAYGSGAQVLASGAQTVLTWMLDKVSDRSGNTVQFTYGTPGCSADGTVEPQIIAWAPSAHGSSNYNYTMTFSYSQLSSPIISGYAAGTPVDTYCLMNDIQIAYSGSVVKDYKLSYRPSPTTGRELLSSLLECADAAQTNCLAPTQLSYQTGGFGVQASIAQVAVPASELPMTLAIGDFDGDGREDVAYVDGRTNQIYVVFGTATGLGSPVATGFSVPSMNWPSVWKWPIAVGDIHGKGRASILLAQAGSSGYWSEADWAGDRDSNGYPVSFVTRTTTIPYDGTTEGTAALADVDGDGRLDLVTTGFSNGNLAIYTRLNTSTDGSTSFAPSRISAYSMSGCGAGYQCLARIHARESDGRRPFDFNGDGLNDLVIDWMFTGCNGNCFPQHYGSTVLVARPDGTFTAAASPTITNNFISLLADVNDDGCTDLIVNPDANASYNPMIYYSGCNGSSPAQFDLGTQIGSIDAVLDWNDDGRSDLLVKGASGGSNESVLLSTGNGFSNPVDTPVPAATFFSADVTGDGQDSVIGGMNGELDIWPHNSPGVPPDLMATVADGFGNSTSPQYVPLTQTLNDHYFAVNDATYPYQDYMGPLYVVKNVTFSDPSSLSGGTYQQNYYYAGAWTQIQGRGFAGFADLQVSDSRTPLWETWGFNRAFPYTGMQGSQTVTQNNDSNYPVSVIANTLADTVLDGTANNQRYFPYVSNSNTKRYEISGAKNGALINTIESDNTYDDYGNIVHNSTSITDDDPGSPYDGQQWTSETAITVWADSSANWCLGLPTQVQVTHASPDTPAIIRTTAFTPDYANCRETQKIIEPSSSVYKVAEIYGFDNFGNIDSDSVAGINMAARSTGINWGTTGQFPMSVTNALSQTTQYNYDFRYGLLSSVTDPNNLTTSWQYNDGFGRKTQETRPDNTYTTWAYGLCSGCDPLPRLVATEQPHDTSGNVVTTTAYYFDMLDRPLYRLNTLLDGTTSWTIVKKYDVLGRVASKTFPYRNGDSAPGQETYSYDVLNRLTQVQRPISASNSTLQTTTTSYQGDKLVSTDPQSKQTTKIMTPVGEMGQTEDANGYAIDLSYDAAGSQTAVKDSLGNTLWTGVWQYGVQPFLTSETDMDRGASTYTWDALGELTAWTTPSTSGQGLSSGEQFYAWYDALSRRVHKESVDQAGNLDWHDYWTYGNDPTAHNVGKIVEISRSDEVHYCGDDGMNTLAQSYDDQYSYDPLGRLSSRKLWADDWVLEYCYSLPAAPPTYTYTWTYDSSTGLLASLTYPAYYGHALKLQYGYHNGMLQSIVDTADMELPRFRGQVSVLVL